MKKAQGQIGDMREIDTKRAGGRNRRRLVVLGVLLVLFIALLGAGGWMGYSYYTYRTFTGNPNVHPSYVKDFGAVRTITFDSQALGRKMSYNVYLPPGYDNPKNAGKRYPVVYLLHGDPGSYVDWMNAGGLNVKMDDLLARKQVRPMIVVMPQGSLFRFARSNEYINGPYGRWADYIKTDLVQHVDSSYRTVPSARGRAIAGLSEGAYGATNIGLRDPDEFGVIGSFSGYFRQPVTEPAVGGNARLAEENSPSIYLPTLEGPLPRIYLYTGNRDKTYVAANERFAAELKAKGAAYEFHVYPGSHSWRLWRSHLAGFLVFASGNLKGKA